MITKEISRDRLDQLRLSNFKAHVVGPVPYADITTDAWTNFGTTAHPFHWIESESYGDLFKLAPDKSSIIIKEPCLFEFSGCVHYINIATGIKNLKLGTRIYKNSQIEARCSQVYISLAVKADDGESTLKYSGTDASHKNNEKINLQYWMASGSNDNFIFSTADIFDKQVAATIYLKFVGLPQYTDRNEKILWKIT